MFSHKYKTLTSYKSQIIKIVTILYTVQKNKSLAKSYNTSS